jgi:hypothetical protein
MPAASKRKFLLLDTCSASMKIMKMRWIRALFLSLVSFLFLGGEIVEAEEKVPIGLVENVILLPWGVKLPARIDTGAATTSLDARGLKIKDNIAEFRLPKKYGGVQLRLPIIDWRTIRSAEAREKRPVVEIEFCLGPKHIRARANLNDRSQVKYPLIIGRNVLKENFVVDCMKLHCAPPTCPEVPPK